MFGQKINFFFNMQNLLVPNSGRMKEKILFDSLVSARTHILSPLNDIAASLCTRDIPSLREMSFVSSRGVGNIAITPIISN
jgi:hypothetical protein